MNASTSLTTKGSSDLRESVMLDIYNSYDKRTTAIPQSIAHKFEAFRSQRSVLIEYWGTSVMLEAMIALAAYGMKLDGVPAVAINEEARRLKLRGTGYHEISCPSLRYSYAPTEPGMGKHFGLENDDIVEVFYCEMVKYCDNNAEYSFETVAKKKILEKKHVCGHWCSVYVTLRVDKDGGVGLEFACGK